ncbi:MAG: hypothetical protein UHN47_05860 [Lachnospiraceae bacterium]|nr:hypothetical protein [Lachnospiraceae bacterium]
MGMIMVSIKNLLYKAIVLFYESECRNAMHIKELANKIATIANKDLKKIVI